jgi:hypothetical protein
MNNDGKPAALRLNDQLGLAPERDAVLAQLEDRTNQTWACKRKRWAALVRAQDAEIERLRFVADAALVYFRHYMQDEAEDEDDCVCGREQHERAASLRYALRAAGFKA